MVRLSDACIEDKVIIDGKSSKLPYLGLEMIESETGKIDWSANTVAGISTCFAFDARHILYSKLRPYLNKVALPEGEGRCTTEIIPLLPKEGVCREYITYLLRGQQTVDYITPENNGTRMPRADMNHLFNMRIPLPSLPEQRRIAAEVDRQLSAVEKAKRAAVEQLQLAKALKNIQLQDSFSSDFRIVCLGDICEITSSKRVFEADWKKSGVPFYRAREIVSLAKGEPIKNGIFISEELYSDYSVKYGHPKAGDILVTGVGTLGVSYLVKQGDRLYFKDGNCIWLKDISETVNPKYLRYLFDTAFIQNQIQGFSAGGTVGTYTIVNAMRTKIPLPALDEQERIIHAYEERMAKTDKASFPIQTQYNAITAMPAAILRQAFSGQL